MSPDPLADRAGEVMQVPAAASPPVGLAVKFRAPRPMILAVRYPAAGAMAEGAAQLR